MRDVFDTMSEVNGAVARAFDTIEMAFVYGVVTLALDGSEAIEGLIEGGNPEERVAILLSQAGYEVTRVSGDKNGTRREWLEVGRQGCPSELIVDTSDPDRPHDTVLWKGSKSGRTYSRSSETA